MLEADEYVLFFVVSWPINASPIDDVMTMTLHYRQLVWKLGTSQLLLQSPVPLCLNYHTDKKLGEDSVFFN
jgi:hypothetical protein